MLYSLENNQGDSAEPYISTQEAADTLGYTIQHTRLLIRDGKLNARKFGRDWLVVRESVELYCADKQSPPNDFRDSNDTANDHNPAESEKDSGATETV